MSGFNRTFWICWTGCYTQWRTSARDYHHKGITNKKGKERSDSKTKDIHPKQQPSPSQNGPQTHFTPKLFKRQHFIGKGKPMTIWWQKRLETNLVFSNLFFVIKQYRLSWSVLVEDLFLASYPWLGVHNNIEGLLNTSRVKDFLCHLFSNVYVPLCLWYCDTK